MAFDFPLHYCVTNSGANAEIGKGGSCEGAFSSEADLIAESSDRFILRLLLFSGLLLSLF